MPTVLSWYAFDYMLGEKGRPHISRPGSFRAGPVLSALRSMLVLAMLLTQQDSVDSILHHVANAAGPAGQRVGWPGSSTGC